MSQKKNDVPYNFWDYGINPILGYRYMPDEKSKPVKLRGRDVSTTTKP